MEINKLTIDNFGYGYIDLEPEMEIDMTISTVSTSFNLDYSGSILKGVELIGFKRGVIIYEIHDKEGVVSINTPETNLNNLKDDPLDTKNIIYKNTLTIKTDYISKFVIINSMNTHKVNNTRHGEV